MIDEASVERLDVEAIDRTRPGVVTFTVKLYLSWGEGQHVRATFTVPNAAASD